MTPGDDDPIPGGWLPPTSGRDEPREEERRPLWSRPEAAASPPVFEQPGGRGQAPSPVPAAGGTPRTSGRATAALVLGIVGLVVCPFVCSVLAIVLGTRARREIDASGGQVSGRGNATAGIVLGWIGLVLSLVFVLLILVGTIALNSDTGVGGEDDPLFSVIRAALA